MLSKFDPGNIHGKILFEYYLSNFDFFFSFWKFIRMIDFWDEFVKFLYVALENIWKFGTKMKRKFMTFLDLVVHLAVEALYPSR